MVPKRLVTGYVTMVGLPLLAILLILKMGEDLKPALAIDGAWVMQAVSSPQAGGDCSAFLSGFAGHTLAISQSGSYITATWDHQPKRKMRGVLEKDGFTLTTIGDQRGGCEESTLQLDGKLLDDHGRRSVEAHLALPGCPACGELTLIAAPRATDTATARPRG